MSNNRNQIDRLAERAGAGDVDRFVDRLAARLANGDDATVRATDSSVRRSHPVAATLGMLALLGVVSLTLWRFGPGADMQVVGDGLVVSYERTEVSVEYTASCPDGSSPIHFSQVATVEIWADWDSGRYAQRASFDDGSRYEMVVYGHHPQAATEAYSKGEFPTLTHPICPSFDWVLIPQVAPFTTTLLMLDAPRPRDLEPWLQWRHEEGDRVPGDMRDSAGRSADLYQAISPGLLPWPADAPEADWPLSQRLASWYLDPSDGHILEETLEHIVGGFVEFRYRRTLLDSRDTVVDESTFALDGLVVLWADGVEPGDPGTVVGTSVGSPISLGSDRLWPALPISTDAAVVAGRFAREVLGWGSPQVSEVVEPGIADRFFDISDGSGRLVRVTFWDDDVIEYVGEPGGLGAGRSVEMARAVFPGVAGTEAIRVVVATESGTQTFEAAADASVTSVFLPGVKNREILSMLVLYLDRGGAVIDALGQSFVVPWPEGAGS